MVNSNFKEGVTKTIDLPDDDADTVNRLITCFYTRNFDDTTDQSSKKSLSDYAKVTALLVNSQVYVLAEKYGAYPVKRISFEKAKYVASEWIENGYSGPTDKFVDAARFVWTKLYESDKRLREEVFLAIIASSFRNGLVESTEFKDLIRECGDFAYDVHNVRLKKVVPTEEMVTCGNYIVCAQSKVLHVWKSKSGPQQNWFCRPCKAYHPYNAGPLQIRHHEKQDAAPNTSEASKEPEPSLLW